MNHHHLHGTPTTDTQPAQPVFADAAAWWRAHRDDPPVALVAWLAANRDVSPEIDPATFALVVTVRSALRQRSVVMR